MSTRAERKDCDVASSVRSASSRLRAAVGAFAATAMTALPLTAQAQAVIRLGDPAVSAASRWADDIARLDADVQQRSLVADDPRGHWIAAHFDTTDPAAQVRHYAAARTAAPREPLYVASLAIACQQPVQPTLPECAAVDRLADWATRDADNGVPLLLLASKAARRGHDDTVIGYLEQAAGKPRMDDYGARGALVFWEYVMALPGDVDRAARAQAAVAYGTMQGQVAAASAAGACGAAAITDARRVACAQVGRALAERATSFAARAAGAAIAERAVDPPAAAQIRARQLGDDALRARCAALDLDVRQATESADPALRTRAIASWEAGVRARAMQGEVAACAQRAGA
jgi:hypothetical protein